MLCQTGISEGVYWLANELIANELANELIAKPIYPGNSSIHITVSTDIDFSKTSSIFAIFLSYHNKFD